MLAGLVTLGLAACGGTEKVPTQPHPRMVILGIDGLDPDILAKAMERFPDRMPNFRRLAAQGSGIQDLATSTPPQSPVAWSSFITGRNPGGHGIYDFIHRDPATYREVPGSHIVEPSSSIGLPGPWQFPTGGASESHRSGRAFWSVLADHGVPARVWRMPINFPVEPGLGLSIPGMLTPAVDSAYGQPSLFTTNPPIERLHDAKVQRIQVRQGRIRTQLQGPTNPFRDGNPSSVAALDGYVDPQVSALALELQGQRLVLQPGQWSRFVRVKFDLLPGGAQSVGGIVRFYLRQLEPEVEFYASPINIDPTDPIMAVSAPEGASRELAESIGLYYTQGMAEDVNGLKKGLLTDEEFMAQSKIVWNERNRMLDYALDEYMGQEGGGLLFFYYSTVDLCGHMMWRHGDVDHPDHDRQWAQQGSEWWSGRSDSRWSDVIMDLYLQMDAVLGEVRARVGEDTLIVVMSDHGFAPFHRLFSLNRWLWEEGYLVLREDFAPELEPGSPDYVPVHLAQAVDWSKTRAYGMGFNGLYLNLSGREEHGLVDPSERDALLDEIQAKLEALTDEAPERRGTRVVLAADRAETVYRGERLAEAPDLVIGYNAGYGNSDESSVGRIPYAVLRDNLGGTFNGNHLMHPSVVAGTLLTNQVLDRSDLRLEDVTAEIFHQYDVPLVEAPDGRPFLGAPTSQR